MIRKNLIRAALGFLIGMIMGDGIAFLTTLPYNNGDLPVSSEFAQRIGDSFLAFIVQTIVSGLFGALCFGGITLHDIEKLPLAVSCISHCLIMILTFIPVSLYLCWVSSLTDIIIMAGIQITVYFIIWLIVYSIYKKEIRELNSMQEKYLSNKKINNTEEEKV